MIRRTPSSTRTDTLFPYTTLVRSHFHLEDVHRAGGVMAILGELDRASLLDTSVPTVHTPSLGEALKTWDIARSQDVAVQEFFRAGQIGRASCRERGCQYV